MAHGLSMLFQAKTGSTNEVAALFQPPTPIGNPNIVHYLWVVEIPGQNDPEGISTMLLTTVYDEDFAPYIRDLVLKNASTFDNATKIIVGLEDLYPVKDHIPEFIKWVGDHDLTQKSPASPFLQSYSWTCIQIYDSIGSGPGASGAAAASEPAAGAPKATGGY